MKLLSLAAPSTMVTFSGFVSAIICALVAFGYLAYKLLYWNRFSVGIAPLVIGIFFFSSIQLISVGIIGEYIGAIHTRVHKRPMVVERERLNFEHQAGFASSPNQAPNVAEGVTAPTRKAG